MAGIRHGAEQRTNKLREAEAPLGQGMTVPEVTRQLGVTTQTHYRRRKESGGLFITRKVEDFRPSSSPTNRSS